MPVLKFWDGTQYVPLLSGSGGPDEVTIATTQPSPATDLWVNPSTGATQFWDGTRYVPILGGIDQATADARYVKQAGDTMTGNLDLLNGASDTTMVVPRGRYPRLKMNAVGDNASAPWAELAFERNGVSRWLFRTENNSEPGDNSGTEFSIYARADDGSSVGRVMRFFRNTRIVEIPFLANTAESVISPASGWADWGGSDAGLYCTKHAGMVTLEGLFKRTGSTLSMTAYTAYQIGTVPAGYRPATTRSATGYAFSGSTAYALAIIQLTSAGVLAVMPFVAVSVSPSNGNVAVNMTYRQGA